MAEDLITRREVAYLFRVTSATVAAWAKRSILPEVRDEQGRPRYRRPDVEELFRSGVRRKPWTPHDGQDKAVTHD
jgi:DNA-binding transcriptional MerR regulator